MRILSDKNFFQPRARLLLQLGDKLIKNENIALLELIKNSYDADARNVKLKMESIKDKSRGLIEITDDGVGMDISIIENVWLQPGSDFKEQLFLQRKRTTKYKRLPIGEKGIGRFGVHKLGNKIEMITRMEGKNEIVVKIDWEEFSKNKFLKDAKIEVIERTPELFLRNRTGTRIIVTDLRAEWDRRMVRELYKAVFTLNSPFTKSGKFKVEIELDDESFLEGLPKWEDIEKLALFHFKCTFKGNSITSFLYEFTPWENMEDLKYRKVDEKDEFVINRSIITAKDRENPKQEVVINLAKNYGTDESPKTIGTVEIEGYIFDRDKSILELGNQAKVNLLTKYLDEQGGIRVYRDNLRINEYGEKGNDWLNLDSRRVNIPMKRISNNLILGVIELKSEESNALIEKTNREGFIENEAFKDFAAAILYVIGLVEIQREIDKSLVRLKYSPKEKEEPVLSHLFQLRQLINDKIKDDKLNRQIVKHIDKIEEDYNQLQDILLTSAGAGLTLGVGLHEVEKVIKELNLAVSKENAPAKVNNLVKHLDKLIKNYSDLLQQNEAEEEDIKKLITGSIFNVEYRTELHKVLIIKDYLHYKGNTKVKCSRRLLMGAIINIIDNSIYWLKRKQLQLRKIDTAFTKKLYIALFDDPAGYLDLLIADNGNGFDLPISQITRPFISSKESGIGLGLHITKEVMKLQSGLLHFPEFGEYDLPEEFKNGATLVLKLKR
jgi:signal transduction histidine kinase